MRIFISAGEPSGDMHGANLVRELRRLRPDLECVGFGGDQMAAAGCKLLYPLCQLSVMWFARVLAKAGTFLSLLSQADRYFQKHRPDALVMIDYPGFHWWLARRAKAHGIPVFYFVPPQLWGWGGWRVHKMKRFVDHVLCTLPFEETWYRRRKVKAHYVGHPYFDELAEQRLDQTFLDEQRARGQTLIGLLPGSRKQEVERNLSALVRSARLIHQARRDTRFLVACYRPHLQNQVEAYLQAHPGLPIQTFVGRTPEIIEVSKACLAVSGSVSLELLYREKPTAIVYRVGRFDLWFARFFITTRYITLVNLLAGRELFPEYLTDHCPAPAMAEQVLGWLNDPKVYARACRDLAELKLIMARPGTCLRTAQFILESLEHGAGKQHAA